MAALATLISGIGLTLIPAPAHAAPPSPLAFDCATPMFNGPFNFLQANGFRVETNLTGQSAEGQAVAIGAHEWRTNGRVKASTLGGTVTLDIYWDNGHNGVYTGTWDDNGFVHGTSYDATVPSEKTHLGLGNPARVRGRAPAGHGRRYRLLAGGTAGRCCLRSPEPASRHGSVPTNPLAPVKGNGHRSLSSSSSRCMCGNAWLRQQFGLRADPFKQCMQTVPERSLRAPVQRALR